MAQMLDFHIHIARLPEPKALVQSLYQYGYDFVAVACEPWEWQATEELRRQGKEQKAFQFKCAFGIHPMIAVQASPTMLSELREQLERNASAQVGEAGLDKRYEGYEPGGIQEQVFLEQASMAVDLNRDLQIHCVGDYGRVIRLLKEAGFGTGTTLRQGAALLQSTAPRPIFHRFGGDASIVKAGLALDALFSIHSDSFRKKSTAAALPLIPAENIRFETDADESTFAPNKGSALESHLTPEECCVELSKQLKTVINSL